MSDYDHGRATGGGPENGLHQGRFALLVEVGVGLVQHQQDRVVVKRARQGDALRLPGREALPIGPKNSVVAIGQAQNQLMRARGHGRLHRVPVGRFLIHADRGREA